MTARTKLQAPLEATRARWAELNPLVRCALVATFAILVGLVLSWVVNQVVTFYLTKSYIEQIVDVFDINEHLARAILWVSFGLMTFLVGYTISLSKRRRLIGSAGILAILVALSVILWRGTSGQLFERSGKAIKCYVITREEVRFGERPGTDPITGRECRPVTVQLAERLRAYERGERPRKIEAAVPTFFDLRTGEPIVWYYQHKSGQIDMFDLMGFHPDTGNELSPVTKEIVDLWKEQQARRPPQRVDPDKYESFDSITGEARIWFRRDENGDYAFYDRPGFDPGTGARLSGVTRDVIDSWRKQKAEASTKKCYIIARDPREPTVRYGDRPGIDPVTGRQCRELTPEMVERLQEYAKGNRPQRIESNDPTFFDLRTGEPLVWYYRNKSGAIEIFDLMGFHPQTGEELLPISKENC